ncbi:pantoate--beta-alanine ligase [Acinetobacter rathckeae]|uniref:pantoate--beta-alanine ligase n=1 Tax=Acinetobacter rathckeae TaxID=2605272 RepID=UPI0018A25B2C|nr:pantoate--beta-alanine ligase [Acinetobacter rathckeae]MBF7686669.1 pantoate--beta-alanine ligase [Acinetobacter rathckeae]MBF7696486.1 pantoate--beta-alanine ligase [Acinetobacter rathckeae]
MKTETTIHGLAASLQSARSAKKIIGFVPTMGNLHEGHLSLVREAKKICDVVVVSIFVNPTQFGPNEDFENYPRTWEQDSQLLVDVGCDIIFAPSVEQMYVKQPVVTRIQVTGITDILCGASRPGHFDGVALVVTKLFNIVQPHYAFFGQKDFQQVAVVKQFVQDLNLNVEVIASPTIRAEDGLALSSRNGYLNAQERAIAPNIYQSLLQAAQALQAGTALAEVLHGIKEHLKRVGFSIDYVEAFTPDLTPIQSTDTDVVLFVAAKLGTTRLIDNLHVKLITA